MHGFVGSSPRRGEIDRRSQDMLERIAEALGVDVAWFLENARPSRTAVPDRPAVQLERIAAAFALIEDPQLRATLVDLIESHADMEDRKRSLVDAGGAV